MADELRRLHKQGISLVPLETKADDKLEDFRHLTQSGVRCAEELNASCNEKFLLHGTKPETLLTILSNGVSDKFSGGLFGGAAYFAETPSKNDQYTTKDPHLIDNASGTDAVAQLHNKLYRSEHHPGDVYYLILCRVVMGYMDITQDGRISTRHRRSIWAQGADEKELSTIEGIAPPIHHHSLVAETGGILARHREFLQYHAVRVYPAYVLAYHRILNGSRV